MSIELCPRGPANPEKTIDVRLTSCHSLLSLSLGGIWATLFMLSMVPPEIEPLTLKKEMDLVMVADGCCCCSVFNER